MSIFHSLRIFLEGSHLFSLTNLSANCGKTYQFVINNHCCTIHRRLSHCLYCQFAEYPGSIACFPKALWSFINVTKRMENISVFILSFIQGQYNEQVFMFVTNKSSFVPLVIAVKCLRGYQDHSPSFRVLLVNLML